MITIPRKLFRDMFHLGSGELLGRLCTFGVVALIGHQYGVVILGVYALAQTLTQYEQPVIDFGLRHIGARLLAVYPQYASVIVARVQRRRFLMAGLALPFVLLYILSAKLSPDMKVFVFVFASLGVMYAISLDWAAWGKGQLHMVGLARAVIPLSILVFVAMGRGNAQRVLWWAVAGNAFGFALQGMICWIWWRKHEPTHNPDDLGVISDALAWRRTSVMGVAWMSNLAFVSIDMLMLGVMAGPEQIGLYSAAYRVLNQVLVVYYLIAQSLYPQYAQHSVEDRIRMVKARILLPLLGAGVVIAAILAIARRPVLVLLFGHPFLAAAPLLLLLACAIPLDFLTTYLSNAYIAWGMEKKVLLCTTVAAGSNVVLNLIWIPAYGAKAAAANTVISYAVFLASLTLAARFAKELVVETQPQPELVA